MTKDEKIAKVLDKYLSRIGIPPTEEMAREILSALEEPPKFRQTFRQNEIVWWYGSYWNFKGLEPPHQDVAKKLSPAILAATVAFDYEKYYRAVKAIDTVRLFLYNSENNWSNGFHGRYVASCPDWGPCEGEI